MGTATSLTGLFLSEPSQQGARSKRKGHSAHLHAASQSAANSSENQVRHTARAGGFSHGCAARPPKMFPKKNAHTNHLKIYLEEEKSHCDERY